MKTILIVALCWLIIGVGGSLASTFLLLLLFGAAPALVTFSLGFIFGGIGICVGVNLAEKLDA